MRFSNLLPLAAATLSALALSFLAVPQTAMAQAAPITLTNEHVDLTFDYNGGWSLQAQDKSNGGAYYAPSDIVLQVNAAAQKPRPSGAQWDVLGVPAGQTIAFLPFQRNVNLLYLGTNVEGTAQGTLTSYNASAESGGRAGTAPWVKVQVLSVTDVNGNPPPGDFSIYTTGSFGAVTVWAATSNGLSSASGSTNDALWIYEKSHIHFNWSFTQPGDYYVTLKASGYVGGVYTESLPATYHFSVLS